MFLTQYPVQKCGLPDPRNPVRIVTGTFVVYSFISPYQITNKSGLTGYPHRIAISVKSAALNSVAGLWRPLCCSGSDAFNKATTVSTGGHPSSKQVSSVTVWLHYFVLKGSHPASLIFRTFVRSVFGFELPINIKPSLLQVEQYPIFQSSHFNFEIQSSRRCFWKVFPLLFPLRCHIFYKSQMQEYERTKTHAINEFNLNLATSPFSIKKSRTL